MFATVLEQPFLSIKCMPSTSRISVLPCITHASATCAILMFLNASQVVLDAAKNHRRQDTVRLCCLHCNQGKGAAIRKGMLRMRGRYGLMADADAATDIEDLDRLLSALHKVEVRLVVPASFEPHFGNIRAFLCEEHT